MVSNKPEGKPCPIEASTDVVACSLEDNDPCRSSGTPKQNCSQVASVHLLGYITRQDDDRFSNDGNLQGQRLENRQHIHSHSFLNGQQYRSEPTAGKSLGKSTN